MRVDANSPQNPLENLQRIQGTHGGGSAVRTMRAPPGTPPGAAAEGGTISSPAQLRSKLDELSRSDPEKFKGLMADVSSQIRQAATKTEDTELKQALMSMSDTFAEVAKSGDLSSLMQQAPGPVYERSGRMGSGAGQELPDALKAIFEALAAKLDDSDKP